MKKAMLFLATLLLSKSMMVSAASLPGPNVVDVVSFLDEYANGYVELNTMDFGGDYQYTAVAFEAGNTNEVAIEMNGTAVFTTADTSNWGTYADVDFDTENLYFSDATNGPANVELDVFNAGGNFRVFELTADSELLDYLANPLVLKAGTLIVGFGDGLGDADFDDIILALKPVPVPAALFLFAPALLGFLGLRRKKAMA